MFCAEAANASFVASANSTGRPMRKFDLTAIVTGVSVMPFASFASVFPVHGATIIRSTIFLGPIGSAPTMVWITSRPEISRSSCKKSDALPNRVSVFAAL